MKVEFPKCIKEYACDYSLPEWLRDIFKESNLNSDSTVADLPEELEVSSAEQKRAVDLFFRKVLENKLYDVKVKTAKCFPCSKLIISHKLIYALDLSSRAQKGIENMMEKNGSPIQVCDLTFGDLNRASKIGMKSMIEFLFKVERIEDREAVEIDKKSTRKILSLLNQLEAKKDIDKILFGDLRFESLNTLFHLDFDHGDSSLDTILVNIRREIDSEIDSQSSGGMGYFILPLQDIIKDIEELSSLNLEDQFRRLIKSTFNPKKKDNLLSVYHRFGINKTGIRSLQECGEKIGVTRERIRQIESRSKKRIKNIFGDGPIYLPGLETAIKIMSDSVGLKLLEIQKKFVKANISSLPVSVDSVLLFARLLRYDIPEFSIGVTGNTKKVINEDGFNINSVLLCAEDHIQ